ncbi:MAG: Ni/Fe hydrogenase subunit alpha [Actinomycetia bacterium]|nr:Ni/Fe hydrogenase subunit alpha [Actinomycetes bacterium]MCP4221876.1 Ni/Fe hydrogenase subunit alpha [Actinomycetes bacterium]MCP5031111.1 Ni/Fe hydrogenase subunit alpha [Actinomycetes bacterium]
MSNDGPGRRALSTGALARVEGEGAMRIEVRDGELTGIELNIYEPPRFFEGILRGRGYAEPVDVTARICGICPVAYQMSACAALEDAIGITVDGPLHELRRLLYCGEWIESHTLHIHLLHAPDFLGYDSAIDMASQHRRLVERGLEIKKIGNEILETVGGRAIHPVNIKLGGFYRAPTRSTLEPLRARLEQGLALAIEVVGEVGAFDFPDQELPYELVALDAGDEYPMMGTRIVSSHGLDIDVASFAEVFEEVHVEHSTALHGQRRGGGNYLVGPLARYSLHSAKLSPQATAAATTAGLGPVCANPFTSIVVRAVEVVHAFEVALAIIDNYQQPDEASVRADPRPGTGHGATEAPRGLLYHRYTIDDDGLITDAVIVPPTSQNQPAIEGDLRRFVEQHLHLDDDDLRRQAEVTIRNHDPCISCATHFLDLTVDRS